MVRQLTVVLHLITKYKWIKTNYHMEVIANTEVNVDTITLKKFARSTQALVNAAWRNAGKDILENANGWKEILNVDDEIFKCVSCQDVWEDRNCVVKHMIKQKAVFFCLNCNDWIKDKSKVFDQGWTLMDQEGL